MKFKNSLRLFYKNTFQIYPKAGDKVETRVGFGSYVSGIVTEVIDNDKDAYCWITKYDNKGNIIKTSTASFSYCVFKYI